jgi:hypothetical protein
MISTELSQHSGSASFVKLTLPQSGNVFHGDLGDPLYVIRDVGPIFHKAHRQRRRHGTAERRKWEQTSGELRSTRRKDQRRGKVLLQLVAALTSADRGQLHPPGRRIRCRANWRSELSARAMVASWSWPEMERKAVATKRKKFKVGSSARGMCLLQTRNVTHWKFISMLTLGAQGGLGRVCQFLCAAADVKERLDLRWLARSTTMSSRVKEGRWERGDDVKEL